MPTMISESSFLNQMIEPYQYGIANLESALDFRVTEVLDLDLPFHDFIMIEIARRVARLFIAVIFFIPLVNLAAVSAFKCLGRDVADLFLIHGYDFVDVNTAEIQGDCPATIEEYDQQYLQLKNVGEVLLPQEFAVQGGASAEEFRNRKNAAIHVLSSGADYAEAEIHRFRCSREVLRFDLDAVLDGYDENKDLDGFLELFNYANAHNSKRFAFRNCLEYVGFSHRRTVVRKYKSKLLDFLNQKKAMFQGTPREPLFKAEIRYIVDKLIDANQNCIDQVLAQVEELMMEVVANFVVANSRGRLTPEQRIAYQAAYYLFKYKLDLIKTICIKEYPNERHMADLERAAKQKLRRDLGLNGAIFDAGAEYDLINDIDLKSSNICRIFLEGRPLEQYQGRAVGLAREGRNYAEDQFKPEDFFSNGLRTYHGEPRSLRNRILLWARRYYDLEANDEQTRRFCELISEDPLLSADEGGNLTTPALLYFLHTLGIFERTA